MNGDSTDLDSLVPAGGSSLRGLVTPAAEPVVTFIPARAVHPDELWSPRGGQLAPPQRPLAPAPDYYAGAESERPVVREHAGESGDFRVAASAARAALRPGLAG